MSFFQMNTKNFDVCGIGNALVDVLAECDDAFLEKNGIAKNSMTLVDYDRAKSLYEQIKPVTQISGGSTANTIAGVTSFGGRAAYIGKVKNDSLGKIFVDDMKSTGSHFNTPPALNGDSTGFCISFVTPDAQRSMCTFLGATKELKAKDVDSGIVKQSKIIYLEGFLLDQPSSYELFVNVAKLVHDSKGKIAVNLSDKFCVDRHREEFLSFISEHSDILLANEHEITALYREEDLEKAIGLIQKDCKLVVATRGENGAIVADAGKNTTLKASPVTNLTDTTGAGDMFASGFLFGITNDYNVIQSARFGCLAAAEIISQFGARPKNSFRKFL